MNKIEIAVWDELGDREPHHTLVADVDLVVVRFDESVSVLYGRCAHRGALMSDGHLGGAVDASRLRRRQGTLDVTVSL